MSIKEVKQSEGLWLIWNKDNGMMANVVAIKDFGYLSSNKNHYRIDVQGKTIATMLENYQTARSIARKYVKGELKAVRTSKELD